MLPLKVFHHPEFTHQLETIEQYIRDYYYSHAGELKVLATLDARADLKDITWHCTETIYKAYLATCGLDSITGSKARPKQ